MTTAVLISGQARTFRHCFPTQHWCLFRKLPNPTFFVSVEDDADAPDMDILRTKYERVHIEYQDQPKHIEEPAGNLDLHAGWGRSASVQSILKQHWSLNRAWEFLREKSPGEKFDIVVRCRPDLWMQDVRIPQLVDGLQVAGSPGQVIPFGQIRMEDRPAIQSNDCYTPWWGTFGGVNDRLAIMGTVAAAHYFGIFGKREQLWADGCALHPETMMRASLESGGCVVHDDWLAEFRICRKPDAGHPNGPHLGGEQLWPHELAKMCLR